MAKRYQDQLLTQVSKGYRPRGHINEIVLPTLNVQKAAGDIGVYGADNLRLVTSIKSDEGQTPTVTMTPTKADAYLLETHALKALASDKEKENQEQPFDTEKDKTELVTDLLSVGREIALATFMATGANFTNKVTLSGNDQWSASHADSDPEQDIDLAVQTAADAIGCLDEELTLIIPIQVRRKLVRHANILDTIGLKYNQVNMMTNEQLAAIFGVKQVITPGAIYNSAEDGQTDTIARVWGKHCWAVKLAEAKLKSQGFGFTVRRKAGQMVDKWYDNDRAGTWVRCTDEWDQYVLNEKAVYFIENAIA